MLLGHKFTSIGFHIELQVFKSSLGAEHVAVELPWGIYIGPSGLIVIGYRLS